MNKKLEDGEMNIRILLTAMSLASFACWSGEKMDMEKVKEFRRKEFEYQRIAYKRLGQEVAKRHQGAKILLIKYESPKGVEGNLEAAQQKGFRQGLKAKAKIVVTETVSEGLEDLLWEEGEPGEPEPPKKRPEAMLTAKKMDALVKKHKDCTVVVSLAGLPPDYQLMALWKVRDPKKRPALVLANAYLYELKGPIRAKFITAALAHKPVPFDINQPVPKDEQKAFDSRYIMVTPDNVMEVAKDNPDFFKSERK